ncbi:putative cytokinetic ring protein SteA [Halanaerobacter jeridensis]|uniref:Membrane-anchored protein n=1 Tax=Halanaerobacter jeridensis TaxID=706427 RepID=A0A939BPJ3_9FIRM|nr:putative cytokinetic ring protein SteA [Halanaerobacter jeridensis]MBM7555249.1 putative membrane-anchored protein [Halanaerobacter jeridensis]
MKIEGAVRLGRKTKELVKELKPNEIAVIDHQDVDQLAAKSLIRSKVKAVINNSQSISGRYPNLGPKKLIEAGIAVIDCCDKNLFDILENGTKIKIKNEKISTSGNFVAHGKELNKSDINQKLKLAQENLANELDKFIDNTLNYAKKEKNLILGLDVPPITTNLAGKEVLIVVRGSDYRQDLETVASYIQQVKPVLIGVDGGADALLEYGFQADIIIGDMDSVSNQALRQGSELIVHAYPDGQAPGMERLKNLDLTAKKFPAPGMSEDIAMLLAYEQGASLIVAVGTHTNMIDFLEKGRLGMASTFLARLKIGSKLVDAKGVNKLYQHNNLKLKSFLQLLITALFPILTIIFISPTLKQLFNLVIIKLKLSLGI